MAMELIFEAQEAAAYEQWLETPAGQRYLLASLALVDHVLDCRPGWRVLDVGCGLGLHLKHLMERGLLCQGLEAGPVLARLASQRLGDKVEVEVGDAHDLPYEDNSFDAVIMVNTLELLERRAQALAEAARVAASRVCLVSFNPFSATRLAWRLPHLRHPLSSGHPLAVWSLRRLVREVLGPVPLIWAGATLWPKARVGPWPLAGLVGVSAAVTPRYMTRPLVVPVASRRRSPRPAHSHGRVTLLSRPDNQ
ncbi:MAG: class I SAM-dependent methyltransferase [Desulfarculus sp.]|nr:class I SAM-dependent methyltransferase [Desulfarculus sp.]